MIDTLYADNAIVLVVKPVGLSSQDEPAGRDCVPHRLASQGMPVKAVHRLDKNTGGVMVYARTGKTAAALSRVVGDHATFCKEYLAVVQGCPAPAEGILEDLLYHDVRRNKSYVVKRERKGVRLASLTYRVLQTVTIDGQVFSLVHVRLHTGRTHQIRVQFASRRMPLAGDSRYGGVRDCAMGLWSHQLAFPHPLTGQPIKGTSLPDWQRAPWCWFETVKE